MTTATPTTVQTISSTFANTRAAERANCCRAICTHCLLFGLSVSGKPWKLEGWYHDTGIPLLDCRAGAIMELQ